VIESHVAAWRRSSFDVAHKLIGDGAVRLEARETRVWSVLTGEPQRLVSAPVPEEFKALFAREG
jgi:4-hydroxybenzoyl-CoA thioesterase